MPKSFFVEVMGCRLEIVQDDDGKFIVPVGFRGLGGALKPAFEPALLFRKPLVGTVAENVMAHGTGALNIDGCRIPADGAADEAGYRAKCASVVGLDSNRNGNAYGEWTGERQDSAHAAGRFPANLIHDGSPEVLALFPNSNGAGGSVPNVKVTGYGGGIGSGESAYLGGERTKVESGSGSAARFFYCAKASKRDREEGMDHLPAVARPNGNKWTDQDYRVTKGERPPSAESGPRRNVHPTVKPTDLMRYLCRLVTPPGGVLLDPFTGSGSTGKAAILDGFRFIGCELDQGDDGQPLGYADIAEARIRHAITLMQEVGAMQEPSLQADLFGGAA